MFTIEKFARDGYAGPFLLFSPEEALDALTLNYQFPDSMLPWTKGRHSVVRSMAKLAQHPAILYRLKKIMGENILLWGSQIVRQDPGKGQHWQVEREHREWQGVSVRIALDNVQPKESIRLLAGSHLLNEDPLAYPSKGAASPNPEQILKRVREKCVSGRMVDLDIHDGEFFIFQGNTWQSYQNTSERAQYSILLHYCTPDQKVKAIKDASAPQTKWHSFQPECILVSGKDDFKVNKVIQLNQTGTIKRKVISSVWYAPQNLIYRTKSRVWGSN